MFRRTSPSRRGGGFTLVEVMIVVAIMALLVGSAALSFTRPLRRARTIEAVEQVRYLDASSRALAKRFGQGVELVFDLSEGTMERRGGVRGDRDAGYMASVASPLRLAAVYSAGRRVEYGQATIRLSSLGLSESYAVKLVGPDGPARWVVITGLGGESVTSNDDAEVQAILSHASPASRRDAN